MGFDSFIKRFLPRNESFFHLFERDVVNLQSAAHELATLMNTTSVAARNEIITRIEALEHEGDHITHDIFHELSSTFITPIDREDVHALASGLDDVMDLIDDVALRSMLYQIDIFSEDMKALTAEIVGGANELAHAVSLLGHMERSEEIREACVRINSHENAADKISHKAIAKLFSEEKDPIRLIKHKEILADLEMAMDACEDVAHQIENIVLKYA